MKKKTESSWSEFTPKSWDFIVKKKYTWAIFKSDLIAGVTVGLVALPLAMAFAIGAGLPPIRGIYTAIIAGLLTSIFGGSRFQIGGPTGAFIIIIFSIVQRDGYDGLIVVTLLAGIMLLVGAFFRLGNLIKYVPYPLVTGFTTGIAVIIFSSQIKDFLGLKIDNMPADFIPSWYFIFKSLPTISIATFSVSMGTLILIILIKRYVPKLPWGVGSVIIVSLIVFVFHIPVDTIMDRFGEIQRSIPLPSLQKFSISSSNWHVLIMDAITIAFLAGIESLLSAIVADGMAGTSHRSNCELMGQGIANIGSIICGGIPSTGAIARTATNIKTGAKTPVAGMIHSFTLLLIIILLAPVVSKIPLAVLSAILMMVAWNMSDLEHFRHIFKAPRGDVAIMLTTFFLTVLVDLTVAVEVGMILAAFLFMKKMKDISKIIPLSALDKDDLEENPIEKKHIPEGVDVYEIAGPFFFGVADNLKSVLSNMESPPIAFIFRMGKVPVIDASGMHSLSELYIKCKKEGTVLMLSEVSHSLFVTLKKFGMIDLIGEKHIFHSFDAALKESSLLKREKS